VYLITGGFGNVGLTIAETLARHFGARLALLTRSTLPDPEGWDDWLQTHGRDERMSRRIRAIRELRLLGAEVVAITCDVTKPEELAAALETTQERFGCIHGVIHAAAEMETSAFQPVSHATEPNAALHFGPKMDATEMLGELVVKFKPDFCMLVSSISTVLGGLNLSAYAGANCFLDAYAETQNQRQRDTRWMSVNWDGWRFEEGASRAEHYLTPAEGAEAFRRILERRNAPRVVISTGDLEARIERWIRLESAAVTAVESAEPLPASHARPELKTAYAKPDTLLEQMVADVWQAILGISEVGIRDNFFEMGGHSLLAIQLISRLRDLLQADIGLTALFEFPTVAQLAQHIEEKLENADEKMEDLAKMLDYVEGLSPEEVKALLANQQEN
jgi:NAD(P)-dependent dehydrogenase (short-subunit alcohol dehydrogenase family)/acyl carrier protein